MAQDLSLLRNWLDFYAGPTLATMLKARGAHKKQTRKPELIEALTKVLRDKASTREAFEKLDDEAKLTLHLLREMGGQSTVLQLKVAANAQGIGDFDGVLYQLMRFGLVLFNTPGNVRHELWGAKKSEGWSYSSWEPDLEYGIAGTEDALELAEAPVAVVAPKHELRPYENEPFAVEEQSPATLLHAVWSVVRWATEREITLTKTAGTLRKADLKALDNQLKEQSELKGFAIALALGAGLLQQKREKIAPTANADKFWARPANEQIRKLFEVWQNLSSWSEFFRIPEIETASQLVPRPAPRSWGYDSDDIPTTVALPAARAYLIGILKRGGANLAAWYSLASLLELVKAQNAEFLIPRPPRRYSTYNAFPGNDFYQGFWPAGENRWKESFRRDTDWDKVEGRYLRQVLSEPLKWLGLVAVARDQSGEVAAFRLTPLGAHLLGLAPMPPDVATPTDKPLIVQPNFEILAYTDAGSLAVLYELERFATRERADRVAHYKLDRDSVYRGLQNGLSAASMREFLETNSRSGVPQNIAYSLDDWEMLWQSVSVWPSASVVEAQNAEEMDAFLGTLPEGAATRLAPLWAAIEPRYLEAARRNMAATKGARSLDYSIEIERAFETDEKLEIAVAPENLDLWLQSKLEQFADALPNEGKRARFQITRESVARACQIGLKANDIINFLATVGTPPVAADVALTIRGWSGEIKPLALGAMQVLVAEPELVAQMAAIEELRALIWLGAGENGALIQTADVPKLKAQFKKRGIAFDGQAETHLRAPRAATSPDIPKRKHPAQRGAEVSATHSPKRGGVAAHPSDDEVDLQRDLGEIKIERMLNDAIDKKRCVVIEYQSKVQRAIRKIGPMEVFSDGPNTYLGAWDFWRKAGRVFRLDRITGIALTDEKFDADKTLNAF